MSKSSSDKKKKKGEISTKRLGALKKAWTTANDVEREVFLDWIRNK
jgi:hypothetical protein